MPDSHYHFVLARGRFSKVVPETDPEALFAFQREGWDIVWDSARNEFEGHGRAASTHRTVPEAWVETGFTSESIQAPLTLFRSVSPGELENILLTEEVTGRGNRFNEFDPRRLVFFGRELTPGLIWHGEDIERQAIGIVSEREGLDRWFDELVSKRRGLMDRFETAYFDAVDRWNRAAATNGKVLVAFDAQALQRIRSSSVGASEHHLGLYGPQPAVRVALEALEEVDTEMDRVRGIFRSSLEDEMAELRAQAIDAPFTSAVLEFAPMDHGLRYFGKEAASGEADGEEFGFFPGSVHLSDVVGVTWISRREIVARTGPEAIGEWVEALREHREGQDSLRKFG